MSTESTEEGKDGELWGIASMLLTILGGMIAIFGGISLVFLKAASENSMIESIANGMGWYFIGKGLFIMAAPLQLRGAIGRLLSR